MTEVMPVLTFDEVKETLRRMGIIFLINEVTKEITLELTDTKLSYGSNGALGIDCPYYGAVYTVEHKPALVSQLRRVQLVQEAIINRENVNSDRIKEVLGHRGIHFVKVLGGYESDDLKIDMTRSVPFVQIGNDRPEAIFTVDVFERMVDAWLAAKVSKVADRPLKTYDEGEMMARIQALFGPLVAQSKEMGCPVTTALYLSQDTYSVFTDRVSAFAKYLGESNVLNIDPGSIEDFASEHVHIIMGAAFIAGLERLCSIVGVQLDDEFKLDACEGMEQNILALFSDVMAKKCRDADGAEGADAQLPQA